MDRIIKTSTFGLLKTATTQQDLIPAFNKITEMVLDLNNTIENPILRSNIFFRTRMELTVWIEIIKKKWKNTRTSVFSSRTH